MRFLFFFVGVGFFPFRIEIRAFSSFSKIEFSFFFLGLLSFPFIKSVGDFFGFAFDFSFGDSISRFIVGFGSIVGRIWKLASRCNQISSRLEINFCVRTQVGQTVFFLTLSYLLVVRFRLWRYLPGLVLPWCHLHRFPSYEIHCRLAYRQTWRHCLKEEKMETFYTSFWNLFVSNWKCMFSH